MKKVLSLLTAITLTTSGASSVVSCKTKNPSKQPLTPYVKTDLSSWRDKQKTMLKNNLQKTINENYLGKGDSDFNIGIIDKFNNNILTLIKQITNITTITTNDYNFQLSDGTGVVPSITKRLNAIQKINIIIAAKNLSKNIKGSISVSINPYWTNAQTIENIIKGNYGVQELSTGNRSFVAYKTVFLNQLKSNLNTQEKNMISIDNSNDSKTLTNNYQDIKVNIKTKADSKSINISLKLGFDTVSIANKLKNTNIYLDIDSTKSSKINDYWLTIESKLEKKLPIDERSNYNIKPKNPNLLLKSSLEVVNIEVQKVGGTIKTNTSIKIGFNFKKVVLDTSNPNINNASINVTTMINNKMYVGTSVGLYIKDAAQTTFTKKTLIANFTSNINIIKQVGIGANLKIYVGTKYNGLYMSSDDGVTFQKLSGDVFSKRALSISELNNNIYIGTTNGLYISANGVSFRKAAFSNDFSINTVVLFNNNIYVGANGLWISTDNGTNFTQINSISNYASVQIIKQIGTGDKARLYLGTLSGLYSSDKTGMTFSKINALSSNDITDIEQIGAGANIKMYVGTGNNGIFMLDDLSKTNFTKLSGQINNKWIKEIIEINNKIYVGTYKNGLYVSSDGKIFTQNNQIKNYANINAINKVTDGNATKIYIGTNEDGLYYNFV